MDIHRIVLSTILSLALAGCTASKEDYVAKGKQFREEGRYEDAFLQYRKALQDDSEYGEAYYQLGLLEIDRKRLQEGFLAINRATELMPADVRPWESLGDLLLQRYLLEPVPLEEIRQKLVTVSEKLLQLDGASALGNAIQGNLNLRDQRYAQAIEHFRAAHAAKPDDVASIGGLFQALALNGEPAQAEQFLSGILAEKPQFGPLYDLLYMHFRSSNRGALAEEVLRRKVASNPGVSFYRVQLADHLRQAGDTAGADRELATMLAEHATSADAYLEAGDAFAGQRRWEEALSTYRTGIAKTTTNRAELQSRVVSVLLEQSRVSEARALLDEMLQEDPKNPQARFSRAALSMATGAPEDIAQATAEIQALVEEQPENVAFRLALARARRESGEMTGAEAEYATVLQQQPQNLTALVGMAQALIAREDAANALQFAERVLQLSPSDPSARLVRTAAWAVQGQFNLVRPELARMAREFPNLREVQVQTALLALSEKRYTEAERLFRGQYTPGSADLRALRGLVETAFAQRAPEKALQLVQQEVSSGNTAAATLELFASTARRAGRPEAALSTYQTLMDRFPQQARYFTAHGMLAGNMGDRAAAIRSLERALELAPQDATAPAMLGSVYAADGQTDKAIAAYRASLKLAPGNLFASNNLAYLLAENGRDLDEALALAQNAVQRGGGDPMYADTLGFVYMKRGQVDAALQAFQSAVTRAPDVATYRLNLALAFERKGDREAAKKELETGLTKQVSEQERTEMERLLSRL